MSTDDRIAELEVENRILRELAEALMGPHGWQGYLRGLAQQQQERAAPSA